MSYARPQNQRPDMEVYREPNWLDKILDVNIDSTMKTGAFQTVHEWVKAQTGLEISSLVWAITFLIPAAKYGRESIRWARDNATSILSIEIRTIAAQDLQAWVNGQPVSSLLAWLPSGESLEIQQPTDTTIPGNEQAHSVYEAASSSGHQFFLFQGIPFILSRMQNNRHFLFLRCLWPNPKPINDLLRHVAELSSKQEEPLKITYIRGEHDWEKDITTRRSLATIDMEPKDKQELLTDAQTFFDKDTKLFYRRNGTPYRRGYLLYGPPGTGKTSLSQAIASEYDLELFVIDLTGMTDAVLQSTFKHLPSRCVVLIEDIDAAGIVRENIMSEAPHSRWEATVGMGLNDDGDEHWGPEILPDKRKTNSVTLSGLLNTLDGPGAKEGRLVILTTNAPDALDPAVYRTGRIDRKIYLGYSSEMSAACTFSRLFGNDPTHSFPPESITHLSQRFGKKIPKDMFTPSEIQEFCMERRGQPLKAVKDLSVFIQERISGKHDFQYDINREPPARDLELLPVDDDSDLEDELLGKLENTIDKIKKVISTPNATDSESTDATPSSNSSRDSLYAGFVKSSHNMTPQPKQTSLKQVFVGLLAAPTRFQRFVSQKLLRVRSSKDADKAKIVESPSPAHPSDNTASNQAGKQLPLMAASSSADNASYPVTADAPDTDAPDTDAPDTDEATFQLYRSPSHPDVVGCRNIHPYDGPVDEDDKDGSEGNETGGRDHTVYLRSVAPKPLEDEDVLLVTG